MAISTQKSVDFTFLYYWLHTDWPRPDTVTLFYIMCCWRTINFIFAVFNLCLRCDMSEESKNRIQHSTLHTLYFNDVNDYEPCIRSAFFIFLIVFLSLEGLFTRHSFIIWSFYEILSLPFSRLLSTWGWSLMVNITSKLLFDRVTNPSFDSFFLRFSFKSITSTCRIEICRSKFVDLSNRKAPHSVTVNGSYYGDKFLLCNL